MKKSIIAVSVAAAFALNSAQLLAEEQNNIDNSADTNNVESITISGVRERLYESGMLKDSVQKTEMVSDITIEKLQASNLTEAIAISPGVRVNNECSMCGVKRVMLNGLRGEHTTILVDGLPVYTMMSAFYGLDAAAPAALESIEIARGAGASLIAPEAIGGTINLITKKAVENEVKLDISAGENGYQRAMLVATGVSEDEATRVTFSAQYDDRDQFDADNNGVSENPTLENKSAMIFVSHDFTERDSVHVRANYADSEIFGGPTSGATIDEIMGEYLADPDFASDELFVDNDVRNPFIGRDWETTEWIKTERKEAYISWLHEFNSDLNVTFAYSHNTHIQDSFYEGFIYDADNKMDYLDARANWSIAEDHVLTFGVDNRSETLRSTTNANSANFVSDSFNYDTLGFYIQDSWYVQEDLEINLALRIDSVEADFIDPAKPGVEIDETIVSPRIDVRYDHNDQWTSRFSAGRGYRAPLSFFESDHGILDSGAGFEIDVDSLERSASLNYALSYMGEALNITTSLAYTKVENLAALSESDAGIPVLGQLEEDGDVFVSDIVLSYHVNDDITLGLTAENYSYSNEFKQSFGVVPVERRAIMTFDWEFNDIDFFASATWVGSRDLSEFGTPGHPTFDAAGLLPMSTNAPAYWTVATRISKQVTENINVYIGANNLFDYTQAGDMQSPLFFEDGGYDVAYIYGPMRGREAYAGIKVTF